MKKILHFASSYPREKSDLSGIFIKKLAENSTPAFQVYVLAPHCPGFPRHEKVDGINVVRFPYFINRYQRLVYGDSILQNLKKNKWLYFQVPFFILFSAIYFARTVKIFGIDLVHVHWIFPQGFVAVFLKKWLRLPCKIVITSHGGDVFALKGWFFNRLKKYTLANCDRINAVSTAIQQKIVQECGPLHIDRIPMGTDETEFLTPCSRPLAGDYILFVGRLSEKKGVTFLIDAFSLLRRAGYHLSLVIIGSGNQKQQLHARVRRLSLTGSVIFIETLAQKDLVPYYQHARIFVGPSIVSSEGDTEGFGLVFVEAMLAKCPIVASNIGGIPDIVQHEKTGLLVEQKNAGQLAGAIKRLLENPRFCNRIKESAFQSARQYFTWNAVSRQFNVLYDNVLEKES